MVSIPTDPGATENLGIPPLAGICSYEEASRPGLGVEDSVERLRRMEYSLRRLHLLSARVLPTVPEWEAKCGLGVHSWLDAEACGAIRARVNELRHPSLRFDDSPDELMTRFFDELEEAGSTIELFAGFELAREELLSSIEDYVSEANPLADFPTVFLLRRIRVEQTEVLGWTRAASEGLCAHYGDDADAWVDRLRRVRAGAEPNEAPPRARTEGAERSHPRRDSRFKDSFNTSAKIDLYYADRSRPADERAFALAYKRLREMDVPEWMGPILSSAEGRPWEYHTDLSRQLCDETRHAMMGEVVLHAHGLAHYAFPVPINAVQALNSEFDPQEAHLLLWGIEQSLMPADTGKRYEFEIVREYGDPLIATFQDFDWADEVVHVKIGRRWIASEYGGSNTDARQAAQEVWDRWDKIATELEARSDQEEWWPSFVEQMRSGAAPRDRSA